MNGKDQEPMLAVLAADDGTILAAFLPEIATAGAPSGTHLGSPEGEEVWVTLPEELKGRRLGHDVFETYRLVKEGDMASLERMT
jgi:hypothetical protein